MIKKFFLLIILITLFVFLMIQNFDLIKNNKTFEIIEMRENNLNEFNIEDNELKVVDIKSLELNENTNDKSVIEIENYSEGIIKDCTIKKTGNSSKVEDSDKKGLNSAVRVNQNSNINIENIDVFTDGLGATGIVSVGRDSNVYIKESILNIQNDRSKGILATMKGNIIAENLDIKTFGFKSSAVATDMGGGIIEIKDSSIETHGKDSAGIYSTGNVKAESLEIKTLNTESLCIDGNGSIEINNSNLSSNGKRGVMIYYTGPSHDKNHSGTINMKNIDMKVNEGPAFYVMNSLGEIVLENVNIAIKSKIFLKASQDLYGELGQEGAKITESDGGTVKVVAKNQKIDGDILVDEKSSVSIELKENCVFTGKIDSDNTGISVDIDLGENSIWKLTGNSYVTSINKKNDSQIELNGYEIFYK